MSSAHKRAVIAYDASAGFRKAHRKDPGIGYWATLYSRSHGAVPMQDRALFVARERHVGAGRAAEVPPSSLVSAISLPALAQSSRPRSRAKIMLVVAPSLVLARSSSSSSSIASDSAQEQVADAAAMERLWVRTMRAAITAQHAVSLAFACF
jgi:hypothetical protein